MKFKVVSIPIIKKNYLKTNSMKFKGTINIVTNEKGIIMDWKVSFTEVTLDLFTTESWFTKNTPTFQRREALFQELNLKQEVRPDRSNKCVNLNDEQINIVNDFFNNREKYSSTIKNIIGVLKGNNPGGEAAKPTSAEMVLDSNATNIKNFVILLDDLMIKKNHKESEKNLFSLYSMGAEKIELTEFVNLNETIKNAFQYMQEEKDSSDFGIYLNQIKEYYKKYNSFVDRAEKIVKKARQKYSLNIDKQVDKFPFGLIDKSQFQKAHIIDVHKLKVKIIEALISGKAYEKIISLIEDSENFLPLPEHIHRKFDQNFITYNEDGNITLLKEQAEDFLNNSVDNKFKKVDQFFLTKKRKEYIKIRNNNFTK